MSGREILYLIPVVLWLTAIAVMWVNRWLGRSGKGPINRWLDRRGLQPAFQMTWVFLLVAQVVFNLVGLPVVDHVVSIGLPVVVLVVVLDDFFRGDDTWRRRWAAAKNKLKWKMKPVVVRRPAFE